MENIEKQFIHEFIENKYDELYENLKIIIRAETEKAVKDQAERRRQKEIGFLTAEQEQKIVDKFNKSMRCLLGKGQN